MNVELVDKMGSDLSVVHAARVSYAKTKDLFEKLITKNRNLTNYFLKGDKLKNPFNKEKGKEELFKSSYWPTFFQTKKPHPKESPRQAERERSARILLETNAPNDYFSRPKQKTGS